MRKVSFNRLAERELAEAADYYEQESPGLGERFLDEVTSSTLFLLSYPYAAPRLSGVTRRFVLPQFPYYILYQVRGKDRLRVLAIAHQKRHPRYWVGRS
ncbi:MAG TPA: type II toxin-antitoxin system RelE/ParE family toxin [Thermoanaerobaculia bacterium]|nr:type II toxin-antitoxin system RelE/ParE family toxin [Thermoanaerobaculia bacterium]